jgi:hypothetical protein
MPSAVFITSPYSSHALRALFMGGTHMTKLKLPRRRFLKLSMRDFALEKFEESAN